MTSSTSRHPFAAGAASDPEALERRVAGLALAVLFATVACSTIIVADLPQAYAAGPVADCADRAPAVR